MIELLGINEQEEREAFVIDNDSKAEWAVRKIKEAADERDRLLDLIAMEECRIATEKEAIMMRYRNETGWMTNQLEHYMQTVKCKETKTTKTYQLLTGRLKIKKGGIDYKRDNESLLAWAKANRSELVKIKTEESVDWATLKKSVELTDDGLIDTETGVAIEGVTAEQKPDTFEVEL